MTETPKEQWIPCPKPAVSDTIRWREPMWDKPSKPRGKPDKIGEQGVIAKIVAIGDLVELKVIAVKRLSLIDKAKDTQPSIKENDMIRRKMSSIKSGECQKLLQEPDQA